MNQVLGVPSISYCTMIIQGDAGSLLAEPNREGMKGSYDFIRGELKLGESPLAAAHRIAQEELEVEVRLDALVSIAYLAWGDGQGVSVYFNFYASCLGVASDHSFADTERFAYSWKTNEELLSMLQNQSGLSPYFASPSTVQLAHDVLGGTRYPLSVLLADS